ncbi:hypothetical protein [Streptomyces sp. CC219B]|uniref:hypothetical protein n=1 Tax=Streptomyces sp. CC219B TaxID=3044574 RepID=UPI0024A8AD6F|nr:hypothetical protein [Streptomyces sp. CC219B]
MTDLPSPMPSLLPSQGDWPHTPSSYGLNAGDPGPEWVALPAVFEGTAWADASEYAEQMASALVVRQREFIGGRISEDLHERVTAQILDVYTQLFGLVDAQYHLLYWPDLRKPPVPVFLGAWEPEHDETSAEVHYAGSFHHLKTAGPSSIEEPFATDSLGTGLRSLAFVPLNADEPEDPDGLVGVLTYFWRTKPLPADVRLVAFTHELGQLYEALPDIDAFARTIALTDTPSG